MTQLDNEQDTDIHWVESESLFQTAAKEGTTTTTKTHEITTTDDDVTNKRTDDDDDSCCDLHLDHLFIDPDPYETFTLRWDIMYNVRNNVTNNNDNSNPGCCEDKSMTDSATNSSSSSSSSSNNNNNDTSHTLITIPAQISVVGNKAENGQTLHSTGLTLWNATYLLCNYLVQQHNAATMKRRALHNQDSRRTTTPTTKAVLELGCGLGIPSMLYHYYLSSNCRCSNNSKYHNDRNCTITIATDADVHILSNLRQQNLLRVQQEQQELFSQYNGENGNSANCSSSISNNSTKEQENLLACQQLIWGNTNHIHHILQMVKEFRYHCRNYSLDTKQIDRQQIQVPNEPLHDHEDNHDGIDDDDDVDGLNLIIAADIIYVKHVVPVLFDTVQQLLHRRQHSVEEGQNDTNGGVAKFILAFTHRNVSIDYVLNVAVEKGFDYTHIPRSETCWVPLPSESETATTTLKHTDDYMNDNESEVIPPKTLPTSSSSSVSANNGGNDSSMEGIYVFYRRHYNR